MLAFEQMQSIFEKIEYVLTHHPKKVLIVEENTKHAKALAYFLETYDINLEVRTGVADAVSSLKQENIDCVILDMGIPGSKIIRHTRKKWKIPGLENLPIIILPAKVYQKRKRCGLKICRFDRDQDSPFIFKRILDGFHYSCTWWKARIKKDESKTNTINWEAERVLKNKTVLIADDDMRNIFSLTKALESYKIWMWSPRLTAKMRWKQLRWKQKVDIVLMDMMMPEMDGYDSTGNPGRIES